MLSTLEFVKSNVALISVLLATIVFLVLPARAASDADVTLMKVQSVAVEETQITIIAFEAMTRITLIRGDHDPAFKGDTWNGMPVSRVSVISNKSTFTIKRPDSAAPNGPLVNAWQQSLDAARQLQQGKQVGRIGYYAPDIVIKGNMINSITGSGFLYSKGN